MLGIVKEAAESHICGNGKEIAEDSTLYADMVVVYHFYPMGVFRLMMGARKKNLPTCIWPYGYLR